MRNAVLGWALASAFAVSGLGQAAGAAPAPAPAPHGEAWTLFGKTYCVGATPRPATCDYHYLSPRNVFWVGNQTICVGDAPGVTCDLVVAPAPVARDDARIHGWLNALFRSHDKPTRHHG